MSEALSAAFNVLDAENKRERDAQRKTAFIALLDALDKEENGEVRRSLEQCEDPSRFHLEDRKSKTALVLEIGAMERGFPDRVLTLSFKCEGRHVLTASQTRKMWNERSPDVMLLEGTQQYLLALSAAMACAKASFDPKAAENRPNNPALRSKDPTASSLAEALGKMYVNISIEKARSQENQAQSAFAGVLSKLDHGENGGIQEAIELYDRLSLFSYSDGDLSIGLQINPRTKISDPRTVTIFVFCQGTPVLEVSQRRRGWHEQFTGENIPAFHTGTTRILLDLNSALNSHGISGKAREENAPAPLAPA